MKLSSVELKSDGIISSLIIDGVDLSDKVSKVIFVHEAGQPIVVTLDVPVGSANIGCAAIVRGAKEDGHTGATV